MRTVPVCTTVGTSFVVIFLLLLLGLDFSVGIRVLESTVRIGDDTEGAISGARLDPQGNNIQGNKQSRCQCYFFQSRSHPTIPSPYFQCVEP